MDKRYHFRPVNKAQDIFVKSDKTLVAYVGGLGSGKTHVGAVWAIHKMLTYPKATGLIAANSYKQLESATLEKVFALLTEMGIHYYYRKSDKLLTVTVGDVACKVHCRSLTDYHDLRGTEYLWIWLDETRDTEKEAFEVCLGRLRQRIDLEGGHPISSGGSTEDADSHDIMLVPPQIRITTTPDMLKCKWLYDFLKDDNLKNRLADRGISICEVHASSRENPYLSESYLSFLEGSLDEEMRKQEVEGEWVIIPPGKAVYGSVFNHKIHLGAFGYDGGRPLIIGIDWGFHRPAAVFCQEDGEGRLLVLGELLEQDRETGEFCESLWAYIHHMFLKAGERESKNVSRRHQVDMEVYCDPAGHQRNSKSRRSDIEIAREYGFYPMSKASGISDGIQIVRRRLNTLTRGEPNLMFDGAHCQKLVEGLRGGYHYPDTSAQMAEKLAPYKDGIYDHLMDALRYVCVNRYWVRLPKPAQRPLNEQVDIADGLTGY